jgi:hypothetical protein
VGDLEVDFAGAARDEQDLADVVSGEVAAASESSSGTSCEGAQPTLRAPRVSVTCPKVGDAVGDAVGAVGFLVGDAVVGLTAVGLVGVLVGLAVVGLSVVGVPVVDVALASAWSLKSANTIAKQGHRDPHSPPPCCAAAAAPRCCSAEAAPMARRC